MKKAKAALDLGETKPTSNTAYGGGQRPPVRSPAAAVRPNGHLSVNS